MWQSKRGLNTSKTISAVCFILKSQQLRSTLNTCSQKAGPVESGSCPVMGRTNRLLGLRPAIATRGTLIMTTRLLLKTPGPLA